MRHLVYLTSARNDLADIFRYIAGESGNPDIAFAFIEKLMERCEYLSSLPGIFGMERSELRHDIRSISFHAYVIFFRYIEDRLEVVNVINGHRDFALLFEGG
jgi:plasmid stabilization system protein ParE